MPPAIVILLPNQRSIKHPYLQAHNYWIVTFVLIYLLGDYIIFFQRAKGCKKNLFYYTLFKLSICFNKINPCHAK